GLGYYSVAEISNGVSVLNLGQSSVANPSPAPAAASTSVPSNGACKISRSEYQPPEHVGKGQEVTGWWLNFPQARSSGISRCYKLGGARSDIEAKRSRGRVVKEANGGGAATGIFGCIEDDVWSRR
ncbi:hypothetical protein Tco_0030454, partial [Tanacetum coccineum]